MMNPKEGRLYLMLLPCLLLYNGRSFPRETDEHTWNHHGHLLGHLNKLRYTAQARPLSVRSQLQQRPPSAVSTLTQHCKFKQFAKVRL